MCTNRCPWHNFWKNQQRKSSQPKLAASKSSLSAKVPARVRSRLRKHSIVRSWPAHNRHLQHSRQDRIRFRLNDPRSQQMSTMLSSQDPFLNPPFQLSTTKVYSTATNGTNYRGARYSHCTPKVEVLIESSCRSVNRHSYANLCTQAPAPPWTSSY